MNTKTIDQIQEAAYIRVRPSLVSLQGVSAPPPFGGNQRTIVVHVDPDRLRAYALSPNDVVAALGTGNVISPSGNVRIGDRMPIVPVNAMVVDPQELANIPLKPGRNVYLRDVVAPAGGIEDHRVARDLQAVHADPRQGLDPLEGERLPVGHPSRGDGLGDDERRVATDLTGRRQLDG